jgi:hypothetical protein
MGEIYTNVKEDAMERDTGQPSQAAEEAQAMGKQPWEEPKLTFVEPTLTTHGSLQALTGGGFFGGFSP